jgi:hypothetical protein
MCLFCAQFISRLVIDFEFHLVIHVMADAEVERQVKVLISVYIDVCLQVS